MQNTKKKTVEYYNEPEVAAQLSISVERLFALLDEHIFNNGSIRPQDLMFTNSDVVLISFWSRSERNPKILRMPRRN